MPYDHGPVVPPAPPASRPVLIKVQAVIVAIRRRPSVVEGQKSKATRQTTKGPYPIRVGRRESPVKGIDGRKIAIQPARRKFFVGLSEGIRARLAPIIEL